MNSSIPAQPQDDAPRPPGLREVDTPVGLQRAIDLLGPEPKRCMLCQAPGPKRYFERSGKSFWRCAACDLVFVHDIYPEFIADFDKPLFHSVVSAKQEPKEKRKREMRRVIKSFKSSRQLGTLLEIGCGVGSFLSLAKEAGWKTTGIEIIPEVAATARERHGLEVIAGDLIESKLPPGSFDVVYMNEVIEHVVDPLELLEEVHRVLRPGGLALVRTGCASSWSARRRASKWWYYKFNPLGHIRFFGPASARVLARSSGFASVRSETRGFAFLEGDEMRGRWYKLPLKLLQAPLSTLAGWCGAGHRLSMRFRA